VHASVCVRASIRASAHASECAWCTGALFDKISADMAVM